MFVKVLRSMAGVRFSYRRNQIVFMTDTEARKQIKAGLVEAVDKRTLDPEMVAEAEARHMQRVGVRKQRKRRKKTAGKKVVNNTGKKTAKKAAKTGAQAGLNV